MVNEPMIIELKNGDVYGGMLDDEPERGMVSLYDCHLLDKKCRRWIDDDVIVPDPMPDFSVLDVKDIFVLPGGHKDAFTLDDVLQIYIDPHFRPLISVHCPWNGTNEHSTGCDKRLHEALSIMMTEGRLRGDGRDKDRERKLHESFSYLRRRLIMYGARIP
jgi:hypothetical protein